MSGNLGFSMKDRRDEMLVDIRRLYRDDKINKIRQRTLLRVNDQQTQNQNELPPKKDVQIVNSNENKMIFDEDTQTDTQSYSIDNVTKYKHAFLLCFENNDLSGMKKALMWFRKRMISTKAEKFVIDEFIGTGLLPYLIQILGYNNESLKPLLHEITWIIANICSVNDAGEVIINQLANGGVIDVFVKLLEVGPDIIFDNVIHCLANISGSGFKYNEYLLKLDICNKLFTRMCNMNSNLDDELIEAVWWLISNLCYINSDTPEYVNYFCVFTGGCITTLTNKKECPNKDDVVDECLWTLYYITLQSEEACLNVVQNPQCLDRLIKLLYNPSKNICINSLRILLNVICRSYDDKIMCEEDISVNISQAIMSTDLLEALEKIITEKKKYYKQCFNFLAQLVLENPQNIKKMISKSYAKESRSGKTILNYIIKKLIENVFNEDTKKEALLFLVNLINSCPQPQIYDLEDDEEIIEKFACILKVNSSFKDFDYYSLMLIHKMMESGELLKYEKNWKKNAFVNELKEDQEFIQIIRELAKKTDCENQMIEEDTQISKNQEFASNIWSIIELNLDEDELENLEDNDLF